MGTVRKACALGYYRLVGWLIFSWLVGWLLQAGNVLISLLAPSKKEKRQSSILEKYFFSEHVDSF